LKGLVFVQGNGLISKSERAAIERKYSVLGLSGISVVLADDPNGAAINPKELS
jgi:hypothetical protein